MPWPSTAASLPPSVQPHKVGAGQAGRCTHNQACPCLVPSPALLPPALPPPFPKGHQLQEPHLHPAVNPSEHLADLCVDARLVLLATASPPTGDPSQVPAVAVLTDQGPATVTLGQQEV